jgi:hypothetical protein
MDRPIISYGLDERYLPEAAGSYVSLWIEDLVFSGQYWFLRAADLSLSALRGLRTKPGVIVAGLLIMAGSAFALNVHIQLSNSQRLTACLDIESLSNGVELYRIETGKLPRRLEDLVPKYVRDLHSDPWGHNYVLYRGAGGAAIVSAGPDGQLGGVDDVVRVISTNTPKADSRPLAVCPPARCGNVMPDESHTIEHMGCPRIAGGPSGVRIAALQEGTLTDAGLRSGDLVTRVNGLSMLGPEAFFDAYPKLRDSERFEIDLERNGRPVHVTIDRAWATARLPNEDHHAR